MAVPCFQIEMPHSDRNPTSDRRRQVFGPFATPTPDPRRSVRCHPEWWRTRPHSTGGQPPMKAVRTISTQELQQQLDRDSGLHVLNVQTDRFFTGKLIPGSRRIPLNSIEQNTKSLPRGSSPGASCLTVTRGRINYPPRVSGCRFRRLDDCSGTPRSVAGCFSHQRGVLPRERWTRGRCLSQQDLASDSAISRFLISHAGSLVSG